MLFVVLSGGNRRLAKPLPCWRVGHQRRSSVPASAAVPDRKALLLWNDGFFRKPGARSVAS